MFATGFGIERIMFNVLLLIFIFHGASAAAIPSHYTTQWQTLSGEAPVVVARGGFSGLFPQASQYAYQFAVSTSLKNVALFCDLQMTKDGNAICLTDLKLDNTTTIASVLPEGQKSYNVNGQLLHGWFAIDFTADQLISNVTLIQNIFLRTSVFDGSLSLSMLEDVASLKPPQFWINVQYNKFFTEHNLDATAYILDAATRITIDYISSPEVGFLQGISGKLKTGKTKFIFRFLQVDAIEPTNNQTYGALLKDLQKIKTFASGILVPKSYIWPVDGNNYLLPHTSLVADAHNLGLEVYASDFGNDLPASYNYSFDPTLEYLQFIDNSNFSVDGVLTDFPSTASESIACLAHNKNNKMLTRGRPLIITHNGASGKFAGCTDLAYQQAIQDEADVIDCSVQLSKDGVAFCLDTADLMGDTTAVTSFMSEATTVPEIQQDSGIFSFNLNWAEIQTLKPEVASPFSKAGLLRNPAAKNKGSFVTLKDFLNLAKNSATLTGILINIENAAYLASKEGLGIVDIVSTALNTAGFDKQTAQKIFIQSDDSSVLSAFKKNSGYTRVLTIKETISDVQTPTVDEVKQFADAVNLPRSSIITNSGFFISGITDVVKKMHAAKLSVYVSVLRNEFMAMSLDYFLDPMIEIATFVADVGVDGIITEFPATAAAYFRSPCSDPNTKLPYVMLPVDPGNLLELAPPEALPPAEAPSPVLGTSDILDGPLPPVRKSSDDATGAASTTPSSAQTRIIINSPLCVVMMMPAFFFLSS